MGLLEKLLGKPMEEDGFKVVDHFLGEEILICAMTEELGNQVGFDLGSVNQQKMGQSKKLAFLSSSNQQN